MARKPRLVIDRLVERNDLVPRCKTKRRLLLTTVCLDRVCDLAAQNPAQAQVAQPLGSWCQNGFKWTKPPAGLQLNERSAEAGLLYFGPNGEFALIY
jgi:hypothetical protein